MIDVIGKGKLISFCVLLAVTTVIWYGTLGYFHQHYSDLENTSMENSTKANELNDEIKKMTEITEIMKKRGREYFIITDKAIDKEQNRLIARRKFQDAKLLSEVPFVDFKINEEKVQENSFIEEKGYTLNRSQIEVSLNAYTVKDIFKFVEELKNDFEGILVLESFTIEKNDGTPQTMLSGQSEGEQQNTSLASQLVMPRLESKMIFSWNTLSKNEEGMMGVEGEILDF